MGGCGNVCKVLRVGVLFLLLVTLPAIATEAAPFAYVTSYSGNAVSVIDVESNTVVATVPVYHPSGIAITSDGARAYVTDGDHGVSVIDTFTNTVFDTIDVGPDPGRVAITPDDMFAYLSSGPVIDIASDSLVATIPGITNGHAIGITPNGRFAYITATGNYSSGWNPVLVADTTSNTIVAQIPMGPGRTGVSVVITPDGGFAYVPLASGASFSTSVAVIDTATNTVATQVDGVRSHGAAITPDGAYVYVTTGFMSQENTGIVVIDTTSNKIVAFIGLSTQPSGIAITPDGTFAYVALFSNAVAVIDLSRNMIVATVPLGSGFLIGGDVAITPF